MSVCAVCRNETPAGAKFCPQCGALLAAVPGYEERKLVTALFADLVGFTSRSEGMDVEDVRGTLAGYHGLVRRELERFGGTVEKFIGDAVVAIFGAPVAHEDDPERAVRAALSIQAAVRRRREESPGFDLHVRIGVNTGEALVAMDANPQAGEGIASGDAVNTAARLQGAAPVDGVLVGEITYRATSHVVGYRRAEPIPLKGKRDPVPVWVAGEPVSAGVEELRTAAAPLVGRQAQLDRLWSDLEAVRQSRSPRLVTLVGVPGIGKSRLVGELFRQIESDPEEIVCHKGRSLPYGEGVTFWALAEIVKLQAGILHSDGADVADQMLRTAIGDLVEDARDAEWMVGELRPLVGLEHRQEPGGDRQAEAFAAWTQFLEALARRRPLVLVFEDLHWADDALLDFVDQLIEQISGKPILVLCTARPELFDRRPGWGRGESTGTTIALQPLSHDETASLVAALLDQTSLPSTIQLALLDRAEGNPLYAQEYVRMLLDRGFLVWRDDRWSLRADVELPVPETVQGIIAARLDALTAEEKAVIQDASVIGKVVWLGAVAHVAERDRAAVEVQLQGLQRKQFMRLEAGTSVAAETQYAFTHALIRDVAYSQIVRSVRADKHVRTAAWIESLADDRGDRVELLAHHYVTALELGTAAGVADRLPDRARGALLDAADRALGMSAFSAAARFYASAFELHEPTAGVPPLLRYRHARARMYSEEVLPEDLHGLARELAETGDLEAASEAESEIGIWLDQQGHKERALTHLQRAVELLQSSPPSAAKAGALSSLASVHVLRGSLDEAIDAAVESRAIATALELDDLVAWSHQTIAMALLQRQDLRGIDEFERAYTIARELESYDGAMIEHNYGVCLLALGDLAGARDVQADAHRRAGRLGLAYTTRLVDGARACLLYHSGEWQEARTIAARVVSEAAGSAQRGDAVEAHTVCGRMDIARGDAALASLHARKAVALAREIGEPQYFISALGFQAQLHVLEGRVDMASRLIRELLAEWWIGVAISAEALTCAALAASALPEVREAFAAAASAFRLPSRWVGAAHALATGEFALAASAYADMSSLPDEAYARSRLGRQLIDEGRQAEGAAELERSILFWKRVGATEYAQSAACWIERAAAT